MALDEPKENDQVFEEGGLTFLVNRTLLEQVKPITVDFVENAVGSGFRLQSNLPQGDCCSSCSC